MKEVKKIVVGVVAALVFISCSNEELILGNNNQENIKEVESGFNATFKIPVVVHLTSVNNNFLSDNEVKEIIHNINVYYNAKNSSLNDVFEPFQSIIGNPNIEFILAKRNPVGGVTNGITRTVSSKAVISGTNESQSYIELIESIRNAHGKWDGDKYLNIFIANEIPGYGRVFGNEAEKEFGYEVLPPHNSFLVETNEFDKKSMITGVFSEASLGTPIKITNTLIHEIGHWLGLKHTYGYNSPQTEEGARIREKLINDNYDPNNTFYKVGDDGIDDTPWTCVVTDDVTFKLFDTYVNVENIMGKTKTIEKKMFTIGQVAAMHKVLQGEKGGRNNIWSDDNLKETGVKTH
ncbi:M43 family zinc metalloprotease [Tenacibaculum sp. 190524A02b]|uniref:Peptidase_M43 domain-containing protein n=1 Tax=Tenacibaculum vairaonense TaxID=3137860 RepID=A0ABM9PI87_9FLAO